MASVWGELKRRNVVKVAVAYAIVGWLLIEVASTVFPVLQIPEWSIALVTMLLLMGFPLALILSWAYELTPQGIERAESVPLSESITKVTGRKLDFVIIGLMAVGIVFLVVDNYLPESAPFAGAEIDPASLEPVLDEPTPSPPIVVEEQREVLPNSVAVLVCENLSPDPNDAYFALSIHEEILTQLRKIRALTVIAKTSVMQYADSPPPIPQIAEELKVETVMECTVRYAGDAILVTAQLIGPETNSDLWSDSYSGDLSDLSTIFAMQADIAMNIATSVGAEFSLSEQESIEKIPTQSPAAYALYLQALSVPAAISIPYLDQAIEADPEFALAYAQRTVPSNLRLVGIGIGLAPDEALELERSVYEDADRALSIDPPWDLLTLRWRSSTRRTGAGSPQSRVFSALLS